MVAQSSQAVAIALFLIFCPLAGIFEPTKHPDPASTRKIIAEGGLNKIITFLGWLINTRSLTVVLFYNP